MALVVGEVDRRSGISGVTEVREVADISRSHVKQTGRGEVAGEP